MGDRPDISAVMPPMINRSVGELLFGMHKNLFFCEFGPRREKDLTVLKLVPEPVPAA